MGTRRHCEKSIKKAAKSHFLKNINIVCFTHLKQNVTDERTNVEMLIARRKWVISLIYRETRIIRGEDPLKLRALVISFE